MGDFQVLCSLGIWLIYSLEYGLVSSEPEQQLRIEGVKGSNPVEVLTFLGFYTQLLKLRS